MSLNMRISKSRRRYRTGDCRFYPQTGGFTKNCFDLFNICITISVGMIFAHKLVGVGIGTVVAVLGVGRVIALFNHFFMKKMTEAAGVEY